MVGKRVGNTEGEQWVSICVSGALQEMKNENEKEKIECEKRLSEMVAAISDKKLIIYFCKFAMLFWIGGLD